MEAPKSPWRYPHLMFRDSLRAKNFNKMSVKFRQPGDNFPGPDNGHGHHHLDLMGVSFAENFRGNTFFGFAKSILTRIPK